jgi:hypothetical protein
MKAMGVFSTVTTGVAATADLPVPSSTTLFTPHRRWPVALSPAGPLDAQLLLQVALLVSSAVTTRSCHRGRRAAAAYRVGRVQGLPRVLAAKRARRALAGGAGQPFLAPRLSALVRHVCDRYCPAGAGARARRLEQVLADYLLNRHVLRTAQACPSRLDDWAANASVDILAAVVRACASRMGGDVR